MRPMDIRTVSGKVRRACEDYRMLRENELVCVGVSGGKDSLTLLAALASYRLYSPVPFSLHAICLDTGFGNMDFSALGGFCDELAVPLTIKKTQIAQIVFEERREKSPCSLCAKMRRGALADLTRELGSTKLALGHHADDLIETFLLSLLYEGRVSTFKAVTQLSRSGVTVIRPLIYCREADIIYTANKNQFPIIKSACPVDGSTKREDAKKLVKELSHRIPESDERMIHAVTSFMNTLQDENSHEN